MPTPKPNDRTTPPSTPQTIHHSQNSRLYTTVSRTVPRYHDPRDARPAVFPHDPRPSREYRTQDGLHNAFTWDSHLYSSLQTARQTKYGLNLYSPRVSSNKAITLQHLAATPTPKKQKLPYITPLTPIMPTQMMAQPALLPNPGPLSNPSAKTKPILKLNMTTKTTAWASSIRKKRRPSEIFNMNFSFSAASRRSLSDRTPEISPRSSFSSASFSATSSIEEPFKRQRIHSSEPGAIQGFAFGKPVSDSSMRGRDLGSYPNAAYEDSICSSEAPQVSSPRPYFPVTEAHPGQLVDFSSPNYHTALLAPSSINENKITMSMETHPDYFIGPSRRRSFPTEEQTARQFAEEFAILDPSQALDMDSNDSRTSHRRKRTCTLEHKDRTYPITTFLSAYSGTPSLSSSSSIPSTPASADTSPATPNTSYSPMAKQGAGSLRRTVSDPSAEAFLRHIRASLEARKSAAAMRWQDYPVFTDEAERGFLDDEPL